MKGLLATLMIKLGLDDKEFKSGINNAKNEGNKFGNAISKIGGLIAGAFAVQKIVAFGKELISLGGVAEGVRAAFERIGGMPFLDDLKKATSDTVSELNLMKRAVMASNFDIPIENLASLLEFATKRAQETGQSVDYLVESIVLGIGRKSPLILDNLGISAVRLRQELKGAGVELNTVQEIAAAVGRIAASEMAEAGAVIETNAIKIQQLKASWDDFKLSLSGSETLTNIAAKALSGLRREVELLPESIQISKNALKSFFGSIFLGSEQKKAMDDINKSLNDFFNGQEKTGTQTTEPPVAEKVQTVSDRIKELNKLILEQQSLIKKDAEYSSVIAAIDKVKELKAELEKLNAAFPSGTKRDNTPISPMQTIGVTSVKPEDPNAEFNRLREAAGYSPISDAIPLQMDRINEHIDQTTQRASELYDKYFAAWDSFKQDMAYSVADFGVNVVSQLGEAFGQLAATGEFPADFGKNILSIIGSFISQLGKMLIGLGIASEAFQALLKTAFTNPASAALAIAAGAALVLLGGAISGFAKAGPTGSGGGASSGGGNSVSSQPYSVANYNNSKGFDGKATLNLSGVLKGDSIYISTERNGYKRSVIG